MKFGKEFEVQMVPEWQEAYMDYNYLKTVLKEIINFKHRTKSSLSAPSSLRRSFTLYRAFSGLTHRHRHPGGPDSPPHHDLESQAILVNQDGGHETYHTTFLMAAQEGGEYELVYFRRLDEELNKVDRFYRSKVQEVMHEAEMLNKQMDALIAFRIKVDNPHGHWIDRSVEMTQLASDIAASTAALSASTPAGAKSNSKRKAHMDIIEEGSGPDSPDDEKEEDSRGDENREGEIKQVKLERSTHANTMRTANLKRIRPAPLEVLNKVTMNKNIETPRSTIKGVLQVPVNTELKFTKENLKKVEEKLKRAFVQFYQKLRLLRSYSFLNVLAFSKIMKKYDKITGRSASKSYMVMVDNSNFGSSDELIKLMERVESTFIKHFANSNRRKGMNILRPKAKKEKHIITFSTGFFAGCTISLILALILLIRQHNVLEIEGRVKYMETLFPLYSLFGFIVLHLLMYAANVYFWRRYRVNYSFIFGFKQGTEKGYREVFLVAFALSGLALASVIGNLDMEADPRTHDYKAITELLPLMLVLFLGAILFCPFNIIYRSSRFFLLTCFFHCLCAPLYKVTLPDFFLGDQLTSQVQSLRSMEFYICYYGWGDYKHRENSCSTNDVYNTFYFIVAVIPYLSRLLQCLRRFFEESDGMQGINGIKYFLTIVAICLRTAFSLNKGEGYRVLAWVFSIIAAVVSTYWDLVFDWGLLQRKSRNPWLRDKLLISKKTVYYVAIVLNVFLRFAWLQSVLEFKMSLHRETMITIVAGLEIIRRGIWNFFRLENEHLNNVGNFRAFKSVPLPFNYDEDDDKDV